MHADTGRGKSRRWRSRLVLAGSIGAIGLARVPVASAHSGTAHASVPHWLLLGIFALGLGIAAASARWGRRFTDSLNLVLVGVFLGAAMAVVGAIGLTEIQIEPLGTNATPVPRSWYAPIAVGTGAIVSLTSLNLGIWRWPHRPDYSALGGVLGVWIAYPALFPSREYHHPLGYVLVLSVPLLVGFILWRDVLPALRDAEPRARRAGAGAAVVFAVFLLFSTGQVTLNPEAIAADPDGSFVILTAFANPLVLWPAVEFYYPSIPLFGALSAGTLLTFTLLAGLVGSNVALATLVSESGGEPDGKWGVFGGLATTGATACCCCAPAIYGVASATFGLSVSPLYWVFLDPASPLGSLFFVGATVLMTASGVGLARLLEEQGVCSLRG
jgi:MFS family permease